MQCFLPSPLYYSKLMGNILRTFTKFIKPKTYGYLKSPHVQTKSYNFLVSWEEFSKFLRFVDLIFWFTCLNLVINFELFRVSSSPSRTCHTTCQPTLKSSTEDCNPFHSLNV